MSNLKFYKDFPKPGVNFLDVFSATADPQAMDTLINGMIDMIDAEVGQFTHIVGLESKGFVLGSVLAWHYKKPFVPIRKKGKLPGECFE